MYSYNYCLKQITEAIEFCYNGHPHTMKYNVYALYIHTHAFYLLFLPCLSEEIK